MNEWFLEQFNFSTALYTFLVILVTTVLASVIGAEREFNGHAAGLRTHVLFSISMCVVGIIGMVVPDSQAKMIICGGALIALGFVSAGSVVQTGKDVKGITTSSTIFVVGLIGLAVGLGLVEEGIIIALTATVILILLSLFERKTSKSNPIITIYVEPNMNVADEIVKVSETYGIRIINISSKISNYKNEEVLKITITTSRAPHPTIKAYSDELKDIISPLKIDIKTPRSRFF